MFIICYESFSANPADDRQFCQCRSPSSSSQSSNPFSNWSGEHHVEEINQIDGLSLAPPQGAFYALIDARDLCERRGIDDLEACRQLLDQQLLALVPGSAFAAPGFVRASYAASNEMLDKAMTRLRRWAEGA